MRRARTGSRLECFDLLECLRDLWPAEVRLIKVNPSETAPIFGSMRETIQNPWRE